MTKRSRVPSALGAIPLVGDLARQADDRAQWLQELLEQNVRLLGQLPATIKAFNDSLVRFNKIVGRLDRMVARAESATNQLLAPLEELGSRLDRVTDVPELIDMLRTETLPALRAATTTEKQVALLTSTLDRLLAVLGELPGAGLMRRFAELRGEPLPPADVRGEPVPPADAP